jgi:hypothetical protein
VWWDFLSIPQANVKHQKLAIASLAYYATVCSRFIPLVRDEKARAHTRCGSASNLLQQLLRCGAALAFRRGASCTRPTTRAPTRCRAAR